MPESIKLTKTEGKYSGSNAQLRRRRGEEDLPCPFIKS